MQHRGVLRLAGVPRWLLVGGLALVACGEQPSEAPSRQLEQRIVGGVPSTEAMDAVVYVFTQASNGGGACTGAIVAPRLLLTARHCISPFTEGTFTCTLDGNISDTDPQVPAGAGTIGLPYSPERIEVRVGVNPFDKEPDAVGERVFSVATDTICRNDIALVLLDRELDVEPLPMRLTTPTLPGEEVTVLGYGQDDIDFIGRVERSGVPILAVGRSDLYPEGRNAYPRTFSVGPAGCPGDSGGPALSEAGAALGVFSIIVGNCMSSNVRNFYTQLAPFRSFIEDAFDTAGFTPIYETPPDTTGSGGTTGTAGQAGEGGAGLGGTAGSSTSGTGASSSGGSGGSGTDSGSGGDAGAKGEGGTGGRLLARRRPKDDCACSAPGTPTPLPFSLSFVALTALALAQRRVPCTKRQRVH